MNGLIDALQGITIALGMMLAALAVVTGTARHFTRRHHR